MEITLNKLLEGKPTIIKNKEYFATKEYVNPFLDAMSKFTNNFVVRVQTPDQITTTDGEEDLTFNRVWIQAILPEKHTIYDHDEVVGLIYGLDVKTPIYKVYRGMLNRACTNLCVFDPQWLQVCELIPGEYFTYNVQSIMEQVSTFEKQIIHMKTTFLPCDPEDRHQLLGRQIEKALLEEYRTIAGKVKLATSTVIKAYEDVYYDTSSSYYVGENPCSIFNYYQAFTEIVRDDKKDILNKFEKTMLINSLFDL